MRRASPAVLHCWDSRIPNKPAASAGKSGPAACVQQNEGRGVRNSSTLSTADNCKSAVLAAYAGVEDERRWPYALATYAGENRWLRQASTLFIVSRSRLHTSTSGRQKKVCQQRSNPSPPLPSPPAHS
jgi:hypothetical protein